MKLHIPVLFVLCCILISAVPSGEKLPNFKKTYKKISPGKYMAVTEVSNEAYAIFLKAMQGKLATRAYNDLYPDTSVWLKLNVPVLSKLYFTHKAYQQYPVVGVSFSAVQAYCTWLSKKYSDASNKTISFRLPSRQEWKYAGNSGDTAKQYTWGTGFIRNNKSMLLGNCNETIANISAAGMPDLSDRIHFTSPVISFFPSSAGMYNLCGNAAEMIAEEGVAMGGSYLDPGYAISLNSSKNYSAPRADIGFRVIAVIE